MSSSLVAFLLLPTPARAGCPEVVDTSRFTAELALADARFAAMDGASFAATMDEASFLVPCLGEVVGPELASHYHRLQGLRLFMTRNEERAMQAFAAARSAVREAELPLDLVPEGHAIRELWATADPSGPSTAVPAPVDGWLGFDGVPGDRRPQTRPTLVQVVTSDGRVEATAWLEPGDPLPAYAAVAPVPTVAARHGTRGPLLIGGGAAAVLGGVLYGIASSRAAGLDDPQPADVTIDDLRATQRTTNTLVVASAVAGGVSVATVGTAVVVGRW